MSHSASAKLQTASIVCLDVIVAALSLILAVRLRVGSMAPEQIQALRLAIPIFAPVAIITFYCVGLYSKIWRYASLHEMFVLFKGATIAIGVFIVAFFLVSRLEALPRSTPIIQWFILLILLSGTRIGPRLGAEGRLDLVHLDRTGDTVKVLLVGTGDNTSHFLKTLRRNRNLPYASVGILDPSGSNIGLQLCGIGIIGSCANLARTIMLLDAQGKRPQHLIITEPTVWLSGSLVQELVRDGEALGLTVSRLPSLTELRRPSIDRIELQPIELTDLLGRPQTVHDHAAIGELIVGRRVLVTGAGGTIGSEIVRQIAGLRPGKLVLVEANEFNLYQIDLSLAEAYPHIPRVAVLCNIRERERVESVFSTHKPELVFHAAALKHVPMVELNPCEGVLTNVIGTGNIAEAACRHRAIAMVQISTDKAVNPTSVMGATKRLGELYCQALDLAGRDDPLSPRFMTVRFGNVLGSSGSLIPLLERQLQRGGPVTVTHPEISRYFMTVREAVGLVMQASAHGLQKREGLGQILVLDMGDPIKIMDVARRMISLAGLRPERDVRIEIIGLRPGEKLYEELFDDAEERPPTTIPGVLVAMPRPVDLCELRETSEALAQAAIANDVAGVRNLLHSILPSYRSWWGPALAPPRPEMAVVEPDLIRDAAHRPLARGLGA
jgi:FlaA1/EpsC-like NDP-sugar epimerase